MTDTVTPLAVETPVPSKEECLKHNYPYVANCCLSMREGESHLFKDGIPHLHGYRILPSENYLALTAQLSAALAERDKLRQEANAYLSGQIAAEQCSADIPLDFTETGRRNWLIGHHKAERMKAESSLLSIGARTVERCARVAESLADSEPTVTGRNTGFALAALIRALPVQRGEGEG